MGEDSWRYFHNLPLCGCWVLFIVCLPALPGVPTPAAYAARGLLESWVGGQEETQTR